MRLEVVEAVRALADPEYQRAQWGVWDGSSERYDDLTLNVHILFDDTAVLPDPTTRVGSVLYADEVPALAELGEKLDAMIRELGDKPDSEYLSDPRWSDVVAAAARAHEAMLRH